jgi:hypothetical protein
MASVVDSETIPKQELRYGHGRPGPGRPKGVVPKLVLQQRAVAEMVLGKPGTPEFDAFVKSQREQLLAGVLPAPIVLQWLNYLTGKPIERVEVKDTVDEFDGMTAEQLRERARVIALRVTDPEPQAVDPSVH